MDCQKVISCQITLVILMKSSGIFVFEHAFFSVQKLNNNDPKNKYAPKTYIVYCFCFVFRPRIVRTLYVVQNKYPSRFVYDI